ncbi:MAG: ATP-binding protein, partial [Campylobacterota bacterium]|nr:ATP-binding protein [Campylobacterota bacterium]
LFYAELKNTIHQGKKWSGEFVNINKFDELSYEKASITPVFDDDGNIIEFIAIKLDITNEVLAKQHLKEKEELLIQQSKMASMGEMLGNIAHQWRQPLSAITALSSGSKLQKELGLLSDQDFINNMDSIGQTTQHLSQTIDDFRNFFKPTKNKVIFNIEKSYRKTLQLLKSEFTAKEIIIIEDIEDVEVHGLDTEFIQVMMNILNNAHDALIKSKHQKRLIFITIYAKDNTAIVEIKDNAGGIPDNIINKVFEPYFTTKHQAQGTGIGLYMSQEMITKHMNGTLIVKNAHYAYEEDSYTGAQFTITLPLT